MSQTAETVTTLKWQGDWRTTVFTLVLAPLFVGLGFWQSGRALEKEAIEASWAERRLEQPRPLDQFRGTADKLVYRRVMLEGEFLPGRDFLLDNRIHQGRYGFEVLSPMRLLPSERVVLVNRGWIEGDPARRSLPQIPPVEGPQSLVGTIYVPPGEPLTLGELEQGDVWPRIVQVIDVPLMASQIDQMLYPYSIRLQSDSPAALVADWPLINMSADKHRAYSAQWFSMAAALLLLYLAYSFNVAAWWRHRKGTSS
jgi:cytochrome oxidase assembly protein ShyY1